MWIGNHIGAVRDNRRVVRIPHSEQILKDGEEIM